MKTSSRLSLDDEEVSLYLIEIQYEQLLWMVVKQWLDLSLSLSSFTTSYIQLLSKQNKWSIQFHVQFATSSRIFDSDIHAQKH